MRIRPAKATQQAVRRFKAVGLGNLKFPKPFSPQSIHMKFFYLLLLSLIANTHFYAQNQRIIHSTFQLDTATTVELNLYGEFTVESWVGDAILVETDVSLANAPEGIFLHYIKDGRYEIKEEREGETLRLVSKDTKRPPIKTSKGECEEVVKVKVFMPDVLKPDGDKRWTKPKEEHRE